MDLLILKKKTKRKRQENKELTDFANLFSPNYFLKNDDTILSHFKNGWT